MKKWKSNRKIYRKSTVKIKKNANSTVPQPEKVRLKSQNRKFNRTPAKKLRLKSKNSKINRTNTGNLHQRSAGTQNRN